MSIHSAACEAVLHQMLATPEESPEHKMADYIEHVSDSAARDFLLQVIADDPPDSTPVAVARRIWPTLATEMER